MRRATIKKMRLIIYQVSGLLCFRPSSRSDTVPQRSTVKRLALKKKKDLPYAFNTTTLNFKPLFYEHLLPSLWTWVVFLQTQFGKQERFN